MKVKLINKSKHKAPSYATANSAGMDLRANIEKPIVIHSLARVLVPTGFFLELPVGTEAQIRPRSGMAYMDGVTVLNSPGTIDADYRGEIKVLLVNLSDSTTIVCDGERIAQMVVARHEKVEWQEAEVLEDSTRGEGGFGSTGNK